jgi:hypothetical protein
LAKYLSAKFTRNTGTAFIEARFNRGFQGEIRKKIDTSIIAQACVNTAKSMGARGFVAKLILDEVMSTIEWSGLMGDEAWNVQYDLQAILGVEDPGPVMDRLLWHLRRSIRIEAIYPEKVFGPDTEFTQFAKEYIGENAPFGVIVGFAQNRFLNRILDNQITGSVYVSPRSGEPIAWLQWAISENSPTFENWDIVWGNSQTDYSGKVHPKQDFFNSRSGRAIMMPTKDSWNISQHLQGSSKVNWVVDAVQKPHITSAITSRMNSLFVYHIQKLAKEAGRILSRKQIRRVME